MRRIIRVLGLAAVGTLIIASIRYDQLVANQPLAPELESRSGWLNTDRPLRLADELKGHVVLLDFWTYCCINCMHVLPDLEYLEQKYKDQPFVVVGVHSAKFRNESDRESIRNAIFRYRIHHPVVIDSGFRLWNAYNVRAWPSFAVIGADGRMVPIHNKFGTPLFTTSGEGKRAALDAAIGTALDEARARGILAAKRVEYQLDAAVSSATGLSFPGKVIAVPPSNAGAPGYIVVADSSHNRIIIASWPEMDDSTSLSRVLWTIGSVDAGFADGSIREARFQNPQGLAFDPKSRTLYVADTDNHAVRSVDIGMLEDGGDAAGIAVVRTIAGLGMQVNDRDAGKVGREQGMASPWDVALAPDGSSLYIAMAGTHQLWRMELSTGMTNVIAGSGSEDLVDGPAGEAALAQPSALAFSSDGTRLYFADSETSSIRYLDLESNEVRTLVGRGLFDFGDVSNTYPRSRFQHCLGVATYRGAPGAGDELIVADSYNHKIKLMDLKAERVRERFGVGRLENAKSAADLVLDEPGGVCVAETFEGMRVFIADTNNHRVVIGDPKTGAWHELIIDGLVSAAEENVLPQPTSTFIVDAKPGMPLRLELSPALAPGRVVNSEAPVGIRVLNAANEMVAQRTVRAGAFPVSVEVPGRVVKAGITLRIEMTFASCTEEDSGVCKPESAIWAVTLQTGSTAEAKLGT